MTQLQVAYQQLQETQRANQAREQISTFEAETNRMEQSLKEMKLPYEVRKLIADTEVSNAQKVKIGQEAANLLEEVKLIQARTDLTNAEKEKAIEEAKMARRQEWKEETGFVYVENLLNAITGGLGKAVGSLIK